jgi:hypothetical protein
MDSKCNALLRRISKDNLYNINLPGSLELEYGVPIGYSGFVVLWKDNVTSLYLLPCDLQGLGRLQLLSIVS